VIRVRVKYIPEILQSITGVSEEEVAVGENATLRDLIETIIHAHGEKLRAWLLSEKRELAENILVFVNGEVATKLERRLRDGDVVVITIPFNGG